MTTSLSWQKVLPIPLVLPIITTKDSTCNNTNLWVEGKVSLLFQLDTQTKTTKRSLRGYNLEGTLKVCKGRSILPLGHKKMR